MIVRVEVNGVFEQRLIRKKMMIELPPNASVDILLRIVDKKLGLTPPSVRSNSIFLLNGRRLDVDGDDRLNEGDTVTILSPLAGG